MKKLLLILLCLPILGFGQVYIPDANFKAYLVGNSAINTNGDIDIQVSEAAAFTGTISCNFSNISDLTGIEAFINLTGLWCNSNQLTSLDISNNTALQFLHCSQNQLTSLDISNNTALTSLWCNSNQLTSLDVSNNTALEFLYCGQNQLTNLDLSNNTALTCLNCHYNQLTSLDVSNNISLHLLNCEGNQLTSLDVRNGNNLNWLIDPCGPVYEFYTTSNPDLYCISVDNATWSTANWIYIDSQQYFSNNCFPSSIQEHSTNKELLKVTDLLGRESKETNQPLLYIYDDGSLEKRITID